MRFLFVCALAALCALIQPATQSSTPSAPRGQDRVSTNAKAANNQAGDAPNAKADDSKPDATLTGEVSRGESFERAIGHGLVFRLAASPGEESTGWDIEIAPEAIPGAKKAPGATDREFSAMATPPYHFYNPRYIEASYDVTAEEAVGINPREFWFVKSAEDENAAGDVVNATIYSSSAEKKDDETAARARKISLGSGEVRILKSRVTKGKGSGDLGAIEWIRFEVHIQFAPGVTLGDVLFGTSKPASQ